MGSESLSHCSFLSDPWRHWLKASGTFWFSGVKRREQVVDNGNRIERKKEMVNL